MEIYVWTLSFLIIFMWRKVGKIHERRKLRNYNRKEMELAIKNQGLIQANTASLGSDRYI